VPEKSAQQGPHNNVCAHTAYLGQLLAARRIRRSSDSFRGKFHTVHAFGSRLQRHELLHSEEVFKVAGFAASRAGSRACCPSDGAAPAQHALGRWSPTAGKGAGLLLSRPLYLTESQLCPSLPPSQTDTPPCFPSPSTVGTIGNAAMRSWLIGRPRMYRMERRNESPMLQLMILLLLFLQTTPSSSS
jgi:hypothetical protein